MNRDMRTSRLDFGVFGAVLVIGGAVGFLGSSQPGRALVLLLGLSLAGFVAVRPVLAGVVAVPGVYAYQGIGLGAGLGVSDVLIVLAALLALPALAHGNEIRRIGPINRAFAGYLLCLVPTLVVNHSVPGDREAVHRVVLVLGALLIGAWLVRENALDRAVRLLVAVSSVAAVICLAATVRTGFGPAEPLHYNKNYLGSLLALTLLLVLCAPDHLDFRLSVRLPVIVLLTLGTLSTQSRGALLGAAAGGFLWLFAPRHGTNVGGRNRIAALSLALVFSLYAAYSVQQQVTSANATTNSAGVRLKVEQFTRGLWRTSPVVGVGVRYYSVRDYGPLGQAPNNAFDSELAEGGLVGTVGFTLLHLATMGLLWRRRSSQLALAALALVVGQFLHGQFDIYWSSGLTPLPFMLAGAALALGREDRPRAAG